MLASFSSRQTYPGSSKFQQKALCQSSHVLMNIYAELWSSRGSPSRNSRLGASANVRSCGDLARFAKFAGDMRAATVKRLWGGKLSGRASRLHRAPNK